MILMKMVTTGTILKSTKVNLKIQKHREKHNVYEQKFLVSYNELNMHASLSDLQKILRYESKPEEKW